MKLKHMFYSLFALNILFVGTANAKQAPSYLKKYTDAYNVYSSHARQGDVVVMMVSDEAAKIPVVINLKTNKKFMVYSDQLNYETSGQELIYLPDHPDCGEVGSCPEISGMEYNQLNLIKVDLRLYDGTCRKLHLQWNQKKGAYFALNTGKAKCSL